MISSLLWIKLVNDKGSDFLSSPIDYDLELSEVKLCHECIYPVNEETRVYEGGRKVCGIVISVSGKAEYVTPKERLILDTEGVMFLPSSVSYVVRCIGDEPFHHFTVNFDMPSSERTASPLSKAISDCMPLLVKTGRRTQYLVNFERITAVWKKKQAGYKVLSKSILYELMYTLMCDAEKNGKGGTALQKVNPAKTFLDESYMENISVNQLSAMCGMSQTHFRRLFKEMFGASPLDYQMNMRILKAKDLLFLGEYSVNEVANAVGFEDANYFSRVFKSRVGVSPANYKNNV